MNAGKTAAGEMRVVSSIEEAVMLALRSPDLRIRSAAITNASRSVDPEALVDAVADQSNAVRRNAAIDALTRAGPRSVPTLIRALRHDDVEVVMFAAGILGRTRDASAIPHLARLLEHADVNVAQGAIESLGRLRAAASVDVLVAMLDRDPWLRFAAVHALGDIGDARAVAPLRALLADDGMEDVVVSALGRIASTEALVVLAELLPRCVEDDRRFALCLRAIGEALDQQPDELSLMRIGAWAKLATAEASEVHLHLLKLLAADYEGSSTYELEAKLAAAGVIRALRLRALYGPLIRAARDPLLQEPLQFSIVALGAEMAPALAIGILSPDPGVRLLACRGIGALALTDVAPQLERLLQDREEEVRAAAVDAVARIHPETAIPALVALLEDPSDIVRSATVAALEQMDAESVSRALSAASMSSGRARLLALDVMRANPHASQRPFLRRALGDSSAVVRRAAIAAIACQPASDVIDELRPLLGDPAADVRREAIVALGRFRSTQARELLLNQIASDPETRTHAIRALGELGDCAVAPLLAAMLERESPLTRMAIIGALAELRDPAAEPLLVRALADPEPEVRRSAVEALGRFATPTAMRHGLASARDREWQVRAAAVDLLAVRDDAASIAALERLCFDASEFVATAARRLLDQKRPL